MTTLNSPGVWGLPDGVTPLMVAAVLVPVGIVTVLLRALPFSLLKVLKGSPLIEFLGALMPVGVMTALVVYTLADVAAEPLRLAAALGSLALTLAVHWWRRRADLSILAGTLCYVVLCSAVL